MEKMNLARWNLTDTKRSFTRVYKNKQLPNWVGLRGRNSVTRGKREDSGVRWLEATYESTANCCCLTKQNKTKPERNLNLEKTRIFVSGPR